MTEILEKIAQPLALPKKDLHNMFGICFDKTETYTVTRLSREDFNNKPITVSSTLKTAKAEKYNGKDKVIVFSYQTYWDDKPRIVYFNVNCDNAILSHSTYRKKDITENLKNALEIVVIEVDSKSLKYPKNKDSFYESRDFNDDSSLLNRVKFHELRRTRYNEETDEDYIEVIPESEMRKFYTNRDVPVQFIGTGNTLDLRMTWGRDKEETWGDVIDKSGYNRKAKLMSNHFKLQEYKAKKIKEQAKNNNFLDIQTEIAKDLNTCKNEISSLLTLLPLDKIKIAEDYLNDLKYIVRDYNSICNTIAELDTDTEYIGHVLAIPKNLKETKEEVESLLVKVKQSYTEISK